MGKTTIDKYGYIWYNKVAEKRQAVNGESENGFIKNRWHEAPPIFLFTFGVD